MMFLGTGSQTPISLAPIFHPVALKHQTIPTDKNTVTFYTSGKSTDHVTSPRSRSERTLSWPRCGSEPCVPLVQINLLFKHREERAPSRNSAEGFYLTGSGPRRLLWSVSPWAGLIWSAASARRVLWSFSDTLASHGEQCTSSRLTPRFVSPTRSQQTEL